MPVLVIRLPISPDEYDRQDQDNVRRIIEQALSTSFEVGAHGSTHTCGQPDELNLNDLCAPLDIDRIEADPAGVRKFLKSDTGVLAWEILIAGDIPAHASTHESGGGDDLDIGALAGTLIDAQVIESNVTQYEVALTISFTQMSDQIADDQVPESAVTQHCDAIDTCIGEKVIGSPTTISELVAHLLSLQEPQAAELVTANNIFG